MKERLAQRVEDMMQQFQDQWEPTMKNLETAEKAFDNLDGAFRS